MTIKIMFVILISSVPILLWADGAVTGSAALVVSGEALITELYVSDVYQPATISTLYGPDEPKRQALGKVYDNLPLGELASGIPDSLEQYNSARIRIYISPSLNDSILERLKRTEFFRSDTIKVSSAMEVYLTGENFQIRSHSSNRQAILPEPPAEWQFDVTPLSDGNQSLQLSVFVKLINPLNGNEETRSLVYDRNVLVWVTIGSRMGHFIQNYWRDSALLCSLLGYLVIFIRWIRRRARERRKPPLIIT